MLPDASGGVCGGAGGGNVTVLAGREMPHQSSAAAPVGSVRHMDMLIMHEHSTMLVSDANSKSVSYT